MNLNSPFIIEKDDILFSTWGYDQTNADFYKVIKRTRSTVILQQIGNKHTPDGRQAMTGTDEPDPSKTQGQPFRCKVQVYDSKEFVRITSYARAAKWQGQPVRTSSYA